MLLLDKDRSFLLKNCKPHFNLRKYKMLHFVRLWVACCRHLSINLWVQLVIAFPLTLLSFDHYCASSRVCSIEIVYIFYRITLRLVLWALKSELLFWYRQGIYLKEHLWRAVTFVHWRGSAFFFHMFYRTFYKGNTNCVLHTTRREHQCISVCVVLSFLRRFGMPGVESSELKSQINQDN